MQKWMTEVMLQRSGPNWAWMARVNNKLYVPNGWSMKACFTDVLASVRGSWEHIKSLKKAFVKIDAKNTVKTHTRTCVRISAQWNQTKYRARSSSFGVTEILEQIQRKRGWNTAEVGLSIKLFILFLYKTFFKNMKSLNNKMLIFLKNI